ncbi:hypothetical protein N803_05795 [Knoellia subterranea KCTC 19937]|uniref:Uncharacterized protein n=2 Tax=Knoellia TaxID=136099 RepID=A0A0A0JFT7_9MICO|nr:hypothetical protein N803_05795 [Knoellia subterranea KCTC 19937]
MTVGADVIAAMGVSLGEIARDLEATRNGEEDRWALGCGETSAAFDHLLSGWRLNRLRLAAQLQLLGEKAQTAGTAYLETENLTQRMVGGETR